jgi:hypothetical protein
MGMMLHRHFEAERADEREASAPSETAEKTEVVTEETPKRRTRKSKPAE